ncbi:TPA: DUF551 domain-containing protein [Enterobacter hormaechei]|nr:DUF551 domain-containing protein [Enterobacter hormaechei]
MSTFTKEQLIARINQVTAINNYRISRDPSADGLAMDNELFAIALASLEAEPVAYSLIFRNMDGVLNDYVNANTTFSTIEKAQAYGRGGNYVRQNDGSLQWVSDPSLDPVVVPLYSAPPAQVSVPDERYQQLSELYHAQEKRLFKLAQRIKGQSFDKYAHSPSQAIDVLESAIFGEREDACRAAMLQGAEPVTTANKLPDGWVACSERLPPEGYETDGGAICYLVWNKNEVDCGPQYSISNVFFLRKHWEKNFTHWMPLPAAPKQEVTQALAKGMERYGDAMLKLAKKEDIDG